MGQEIRESHFTPEDFGAYAEALRVETALLGEWFRQGIFSPRDRMGGFELEAWLIDSAARPAAINEQFLARLDNPMVVPELARFNVELNDYPQHLWGSALSRFEASLGSTWERCRRVAAELDTRLLMIGILPTVRESELTQANMSDMKRYRALNEQVLRLREGKPLALDIHGREHLKTAHESVMLESATTSFQLHLKVHPRHALRAYNASLVLSAPMVALAANSPYLFGHDLWDETRIPLFEQSVSVGGFAGASHGPMRRVTFGSGYVRNSIFECFTENEQHYPVLLPMTFNEGLEQMSHLRLHNGTIWRWNRPLIGFDYDGIPHLRIEHRVVPGGPSVVDLIANAAFFFGLSQALIDAEIPPEQQLPFDRARDNFYAAARHSLEAPVIWLDGKKGPIRSLILEQLLPLARRGLETLEIDVIDIDKYLAIIAARVRSTQTGTAWQRAYVARHGVGMEALTEAYYQRQEGGQPVHEWSLNRA
ncbi:MAG: glutamate--cysteine ligase [Gammaproteobacteria bacterium]|nr:glutamate--cysteine ligase [Gammaproteobacteria bacterium]